MTERLMYVTKKQVSDFVDRTTKRLKIGKSELLGDVKEALTELNQYPTENSNQIKFYSRVEKFLS